MRSAETCLAIIRTRGERRLPIDDLYRQLFNADFFTQAYGKISRNSGAMTPGVTSETADGMSLERIRGLIELLRFERYRWTPVRRVLRHGEGRPPRWVVVPTWSDRLLQEAMRMMLDAYYEPQFSDRSHGFRRGRGCHSALQEIYYRWRGTVWFIEGDIRGCFDHIDRAVLLSILREKIVDRRFLRLIEGYLGAGYLEDWRRHATTSGTPQGGILSPILSNIYLNQLDTFVESSLIPRFNRGSERKPNQDYNKLYKRAWYLESTGRRDEARGLRKRARQLPAYVLDDPGYRRLKYVRYADNILIGFVGTMREAVVIRLEVAQFLRDQLHLDLADNKTRLVHARSEAARFLGYDVTVTHDNEACRNGRRRVNGVVSLRVPREVITEKSKGYRKRGRPIHRYELVNRSVVDIVNHYESEFRGIANFYRMAHNLAQLSRLRGLMQRSLTKTLASKFRITVAEVYRRSRGFIRDEYGNRKSVLQVQVQREGKPPLIARWGAVSLRWRIEATIDDRLTPYRALNATELVQRLLADECEWCGSKESIEVHHVRALRDLKPRGRSERPLWARLMAARRRKTLVLCRACHVDLHAGRLQRASGVLDTGEPDDAKVSSPVRWGADGKGRCEPDLAGGLPYENREPEASPIVSGAHLIADAYTAAGVLSNAETSNAPITGADNGLS